MIGGQRHASRESFSKVIANFRNEGCSCAGWLYRPARPRRAPLLVMGPGLAAERTFGYPAYAERLAARGYAVFLFDYRGFGASEGRPRQLVSVADQLSDWRAAIDRATALEGVDGDRLALWGASLAGGHVLRLAAGDRRVDAAVAQTPFLDCRALLRANGPRWLSRALVAGLGDRLTSLAGRRRRIRVVPDDQGANDGLTGNSFALFPHPDLGDALRELVPLRSDWENAVPARVVLDLLGYRPVEDAPDVRAETLLLAGAVDPIVPSEVVADAADSLPAATLVRLPTGHFEFFSEPWVERAVAHGAAFLDGIL